MSTPFNLDFVRGALAYKHPMDEIRVAIPVSKRKWVDPAGVHEDTSTHTLADFLGEFGRQHREVPAYLQVIGLSYSRPGFVIVSEPNQGRRSQIPGGDGIMADFSMDDLMPLDPPL